MTTVNSTQGTTGADLSAIDQIPDAASITPETILALISQRTEFVQGQLKTILTKQRNMNQQMKAINDCMATLEQFTGDKGLKGGGDDHKALKALQDCYATLQSIDPKSPLLASIGGLRDEMINDFGNACKQAMTDDPPAILRYDGNPGDAALQSFQWTQSGSASVTPDKFDPQKDICGTIEEPFGQIDGKGVQSFCDRLKDVTSAVNADSSMMMLDAQDLASKLQQVNQFGSNLLQAVEDAPKTAIGNIGRG